ncbi:nucleotidyltransferase family protein [Rummeliibacillus sp. TYF-LIM-RU47]|uniref:nucleotidyltransferase family protein n=1 Tax=Rummeliibacillus sp. TYF-LIM-RU47 TaxID=2608406 RepID=UPI00123B06A5|nr:nucleotidyltransferase family protein [Rummeliibacillus sp. TYF-LIM-RU47]
MILEDEKDIVEAIKKDSWMMDVLKTAKILDLPDWWICAGFVRSKVWDVLHNFNARTPLPDIDVIYFDSSNINELEEKNLERKLRSLMPNIPWSVKNQARMHVLNNMSPYTSSIDGISKFPETATALGVKLDEKDNLLLAAPWGVKDVINLKVKPTPYYLETDTRISIYENRVIKKGWNSISRKIEVFEIGKILQNKENSH